jgi:hypothetical protein
MLSRRPGPGIAPQSAHGLEVKTIARDLIKRVGIGGDYRKEKHRPRYLEPRLAEELGRIARAFQAEEIEAVRAGKVSE